MAENDEEKGFAVKDKRLFTEEGDVRPETAEEGHGEVKDEEPKETQQPEQRVEEEAPPLPEITFPAFVLSLHTSALLHIGDLQDPVSGETAVNLTAAKQMIDILSMLQDKTAGNLAEDEKKLLEEVLFDLRMKYIRKTEKQ